MNTGRPASVSGLYANEKFTSKYIDESFTPEYPFGYGLSYTTFSYSNLRVSSPRMDLGGQITVWADIANTGHVEADEIVQFYTRQLVGSLTRPVRELKSFQRIRLKPGETKTVEFLLKSDDLAYYNAKGTLITEPGKFDVWIAPDSASGLSGEFTLTNRGNHRG